MSLRIEKLLGSEEETIALAQALAECLQVLLKAEPQSILVYLNGDLGAGKSFFSRAFVHYFLPEARVKSPTYNLLESYRTEDFVIHHMDLYRLCDPEELEFLGVRELFSNDDTIALVEWPSKGEGVLPQADLEIEIVHLPDENQRKFSLKVCNNSLKVEL